MKVKANHFDQLENVLKVSNLILERNRIVETILHFTLSCQKIIKQKCVKSLKRTVNFIRFCLEYRSCQKT